MAPRAIASPRPTVKRQSAAVAAGDRRPRGALERAALCGDARAMLEMAFDGPIREVALYARGAVITRRVDVPRSLPDEEDVDVVVRGVTPIAAAGSARATWAGGAGEIVLVRSRVVVPERSAPAGDVVERVRELERERDRIAVTLRYLAARKAAVAGIVPSPRLDARFRPVAPPARVSDAVLAGQLVGGISAELDAEIIDLQERAEDTERALERAQVAARHARTADRVGAAHPTTEILVRLAAGEGRGGALDVTYAVPGARWWPSYSVRFRDAGRRAAWALDALVAQATGEDWSSAAMTFSSVELLRDARLPELASWRWGRAQRAPSAGYRPAPQGLDELFAGYDAAARGTRAQAAAPSSPLREDQTAVRFDEPASAPLDVDDEEATDMTMAPAISLGRSAPPSAPGYGTPPQGIIAAPAPRRAMVAPPPPAMAPMAQVLSAAPTGAVVGAARGAFGGGDGGGEMLRRRTQKRSAGPALDRLTEEPLEQGEAAEPDAIEPADEWLDFDRLALPPMDDARRGRLVQAPAAAGSGGDGARDAAAKVERAQAPAHAVDPRSLPSSGPQVRYRAEAPGDVASDGLLHRVAVAAGESSAEARLVAVPRESPDVYRESHLTNPFATALLPGPVDVFFDGALLTTSRIALVGAGGKVVLGLGVEDRMRVAKNARTEEATAGLLGGKITVDHTVTIDLASALAHDVTVDVFERIPVVDEKEKDVEVELRQAVPKAERYTQADRGAPLRGGHRWRVPVAAGGKAQVEYVYRVTLPAKAEIQGGNRRE